MKIFSSLKLRNSEPTQLRTKSPKRRKKQRKRMSRPTLMLLHLTLIQTQILHLKSPHPDPKSQRRRLKRRRKKKRRMMIAAVKKAAAPLALVTLMILTTLTHPKAVSSNQTTKRKKMRLSSQVSFPRNMLSWLYLTKRKLHNKEDGSG